MYVVGLGRRKRVGKDSFANAFREAMIEECYADIDLSPKSYTLNTDEFGEHFKVDGFGSYLKADAYAMFSWAGLREEAFYETAEGTVLREQPLSGLPRHTPRSIWIAVGMFGRSIDEDYWVNKLFTHHKLVGTKVLIIKDVRFANEARIIREQSEECSLIEIENPRIEMPTDVADTQCLSPNTFHNVIANTGDLEAWILRAKQHAKCFAPWRKTILQELGYL